MRGRSRLWLLLLLERVIQGSLLRLLLRGWLAQKACVKTRGGQLFAGEGPAHRYCHTHRPQLLSPRIASVASGGGGDNNANGRRPEAAAQYGVTAVCPRPVGTSAIGVVAVGSRRR